MSALSNSQDLLRLPPAFNDVPTDADYAMDLISQRVALGLDVTSTEQRAKRRKPRNVQVGGADAAIKEEGDKQVDWRKWSDRAALGKAWAEDSKRLFTGNEVCDLTLTTIRLPDGSILVAPHGNMATSQSADANANAAA